MWDEARRFGAGIVGGDLVAAPQWVISVTVLGDLGGRDPVRLDGARPGDSVAVIGGLGRSAAGYALLRNAVRGHDELRRLHLTPDVPYGQGRVAADAGATAMTDVSDGLVADLGHVADASGVGIDAFAARPWRPITTRSPRRPRRRSRTPGRGCSAGERTTRWSRRSPGRCPTAGAASASWSTARRGCWWTERAWGGNAGWQSF